jgi:hypothetical protein
MVGCQKKLRETIKVRRLKMDVLTELPKTRARKSSLQLTTLRGII